ncbi:MAG: hypothetical protein IT244_10095 [Bacteroidia bacterium]|nr:hypothetical protein [Bacteroidia bacterium]
MINDSFSYLNDLIVAMEPHLKELGINHFIVGAISRDLALSVHKDFRSSRITEDVDVAIQISSIDKFEDLIKRLIDKGEFQQIGKNPIKLLFKQAIEVDLLPFGDAENEKREVYIPMAGRPFVLSVPGLSEVQEHVKEFQLPNGQIIYYCPLEGIVLLKLVSWYEKPERIKDSEDIYHICKVYFDYCGDKIYTDTGDLMDSYSIEDPEYIPLVASHYLGRQVRKMTKENPMLVNIVNRKLEKYDGIFRALLDGFNDK